MIISENLKKIKEEIKAAAIKCGRDASSVTLIAVSKRQPIEAIEQAYLEGQRDFGENYVQELIKKKESLMHLNDIRWHLIGPLQTNKTKLALQAADVFHVLDSEKLLNEINKRVRDSESRKPWPVFIQVNVDDEASKSGVSFEEAENFAKKAQQTSEIKLLGFMCIPAPTNPNLRQSFQKMARLAEKLQLKLSMGMSSDFVTAIEEGSHFVRVGTRIFGERTL